MAGRKTHQRPREAKEHTHNKAGKMDTLTR